jgi:crotonobetainyl-CoA:carnitine CoA-transferase CaiB-like acyl-CoA transferase
VVGIQAALIEREKTGKGQFVDISLCESAMILGISSLSQGLSGVLGNRGTGHLDGGLPNYNIYATSDGKYLSVGALEPHFWSKFCRFVQAEYMIKASTEEVKKFIASKTRAEWVSLAKECDACIEPILGVSELTRHPQHVARGVFLHHPTTDTTTATPTDDITAATGSGGVSANVSAITSKSDNTSSILPPQLVLGPRLSNHPARLLTRASYHGEHNKEVLREADTNSEVQISSRGTTSPVAQSAGPLPGPLHGLKVLDLSRLLPGPLCTHLLVRLGAKVVKIEAPDGDYARFVPPLMRWKV